jgi:CDGSH-type Zn-finger protein
MDEQPRIQVQPNGPYVVTGRVPLVRTAQVETEYGEPIDWEPLEPVAVKEPERYELCRCGRTGTPPFCDGSEKDEPAFDGSEVAKHEPRSVRAQTFVGDGVVITDNRSFCTHAGYCGDRFATVWQMLADSDDPAIRERIQRMVSLCPSGRIDWSPEVGSEAVEPPYEPAVAVIEDGPLWARGGIQVTGADGTAYEIRNRVTLCRCGHSHNKPFCDGSHVVWGVDIG